nr:glycosyltransferase [Streptomyces deccanensis]
MDLDRRTGPASARYAGLEHAAGDYIAFLDDDDLFLPGHLAAGCEALEHGDADFAYTGAIVSNRRLTKPESGEIKAMQAWGHIPQAKVTTEGHRGHAVDAPRIHSKCTLHVHPLKLSQRTFSDSPLPAPFASRHQG